MRIWIRYATARRPGSPESNSTTWTVSQTKRLLALKLEQVFGRQFLLAPELADRIIERSGGNPFFIEELLNYLKNQDLGEQKLHTLEQSELPSSLHSLILSRIDQLMEEQKATLKVASIVGRNFEVATLWGFYPS